MRWRALALRPKEFSDYTVIVPPSNATYTGALEQQNMNGGYSFAEDSARTGVHMELETETTESSLNVFCDINEKRDISGIIFLGYFTQKPPSRGVSGGQLYYRLLGMLAGVSFGTFHKHLL